MRRRQIVAGVAVLGGVTFSVLKSTDKTAAVYRRIRDLLADGADTGDLRDDVAPDELATY